MIPNLNALIRLYQIIFTAFYQDIDKRIEKIRLESLQFSVEEVDEFILQSVIEWNFATIDFTNKVNYQAFFSLIFNSLRQIDEKKLIIQSEKEKLIERIGEVIPNNLIWLISIYACQDNANPQHTMLWKKYAHLFELRHLLHHSPLEWGMIDMAEIYADNKEARKIYEEKKILQFGQALKQRLGIVLNMQCFNFA